MTVIEHHPAGPLRAMDARAACSFLRSQARWLAQALDNADTADVVGTSLGVHDASHAAWLDLIADVERLDSDAAAAVSAVYSYHGRVVGSLERGLDPLLTGQVQGQVRQLLGRRLESLTTAAVNLIEGLGSGKTDSE